MTERSPDTLNAGFRRILYDAMVLSESLRVVRCCLGYPKPNPEEISGDVEAHHLNAMLQIRSMDWFLIDHDDKKPDTMRIHHFGCKTQESRLPGKDDPCGRSFHTFGPHKSWDAVIKDKSKGAAQVQKPELLRIGRALLDGFEQFRQECCEHGINVTDNKHAVTYDRIYKGNKRWLDANACDEKLAP